MHVQTPTLTPAEAINDVSMRDDEKHPRAAWIYPVGVSSWRSMAFNRRPSIWK